MADMTDNNNFTPRFKDKKVIAFCGTRGVPANYGGFETAVDEISSRFIKAGYECEVFCRCSSRDEMPKYDNNRHLVYVKGSRFRILETFISSYQTGRFLWRHRKRYSHVYWFNNANLPGILLTILAGIPLTVNTDGLEWRRAKWSWPFKAYYVLSSFLVCRLCPSLVSDSHAIRNYYKRYFFKNTQFIPYGVPSEPEVSENRQKEIISQYNLEAGRYFLQITRIEPDNLPLQVARAFLNSGLGKKDFKLFFIGYKEATPYAQRLIEYDGRFNIRVNKALYDRDVLYTLRKNCFCYVHGNSVGGTNPALLEAMAVCPRVMAIDCEFSREVLGDKGYFFDPDNIEPTFDRIVNTENQSDYLRKRVFGKYNWDAVAESYMNLAEGRPADYRPGGEAEELVPAVVSDDDINR